MQRFIKFVLLISLLPILFLGCAQQPKVTLDIKQTLAFNNKESVILLHGLWRDSTAMEPMKDFLSRYGYNVTNISYPSNKHNIETLVADYLGPVVSRVLEQNPNANIHFVTHSMGGILVRHYLKQNTLSNLGKVVMLSPPNQGTELSNIATDMSLEWHGPAGKQLTSDKGSWVNQLGPVNFELGIIAGNHSTNWLTSWVIDGENDGVVSVQNTKVAGMSDFIIVPEKHFRIRKFPIALQQTVYFLQNGVFYKKRANYQHIKEGK